MAVSQAGAAAQPAALRFLLVSVDTTVSLSHGGSFAPGGAAPAQSLALSSPLASLLPSPLSARWCECAETIFRRGCLDISVDLEHSQVSPSAHLSIHPALARGTSLPEGLRLALRTGGGSGSGRGPTSPTARGGGDRGSDRMVTGALQRTVSNGSASSAVSGGGGGGSGGGSGGGGGGGSPALFAVLAQVADAVPRLVMTLDLATAAVYSGSADIARVLREVCGGSDEVAVVREALGGDAVMDRVFAVVGHSVASFASAAGSHTLHIFACNNMEARVAWAQRVQAAIADAAASPTGGGGGGGRGLMSPPGSSAPTTLLPPVPPRSVHTGPTASPGLAGPAAAGDRRSDAAAAIVATSSAGISSVMAPAASAAAAEAFLQTAQRGGVSRMLPQEIKSALRHYRRKPEKLLTNPHAGWHLLLRAAKALDRFLHGEAFRASTVADPSPVFALPLDGGDGDDRDVVGSDSDGDGDGDGDSEGDSEGGGAGLPAVPDEEGEHTDDSFEFMEKEYTKIAPATSAPHAARKAAARLKSSGAHRQARENYTFIRRHHFVAIAGQYYTVMCDKYTAGTVFDELTARSAPTEIKVMLPQSAAAAAGTAAPDAGDASGGGGTHSSSNDSVAPGDPSNEAPAAFQLELVHSVERVMTYDVFERFTRSLARPLMTPPAAWEALRESLCLDPRELVVKVEEMMELFFTATVYAAASIKPEGEGGGRPGGRSRAGTGTPSTLQRGASERHTPADDVVLMLASKAVDMPLPLPQAVAPPDVGGGGGGGGVDGRQGRGATRHSDNPFRLGRPLRTFVQDRDAAQYQLRRKLYYDSDSTFVSTSEEGGLSQREEMTSQHPASAATPATAPSLIRSQRHRANGARDVRSRSSTLGDSVDGDGDDGVGGPRRGSDASGNHDQPLAGRARGQGVPQALADASFDADLDDSDILGLTARQGAPSTLSREGEGGGGGGSAGGDGKADEGRARGTSFAVRLGKGMASLFKRRNTGATGVGGGGGGGSVGGDAPTVATASPAGGTSKAPPALPSATAGQPTTASSLARAVGAAAAAAGGVTAAKPPTYDQMYGGTGLTPWVIGQLLHEGETEVRLSGTLIITDRNIYFLLNNKNDVLILPLRALSTAEVCRTSVRTLGMQLGRTSDNGLALPECEVRRVVIDPDADTDAQVTPLKSLFTACSLLRGTVLTTGTHCPLGRTLAVLLPRPTVTLAFSKVKDFVLSRGGERAGGRRMVVKAAIDELIAAHRVAAGFEGVMHEVVAANHDKLAALFAGVPQQGSSGGTVGRAGAGGAGAGGRNAVSSPLPPSTRASASAAPTRQVPQSAMMRALASLCGCGCRRRSGVVATRAGGGAASASGASNGTGAAATRSTNSAGAAAPAAANGSAGPSSSMPLEVSPWLLYAASGGITFANATLLPVSGEAWKRQLTRNRRDEVAFPRRLQLYAALNVIRSRALLKATGRVTSSLFLCNNYYRGLDVSACESVRRFMLQDDPRWMLRLAAWICHEKGVLRRRFEGLQEFDRRKFKYELDVMLDNAQHPLNTLRNGLIYVYAWETPILSFAVYSWLLLLCWHNLVPLLFPIALFLHMAVILGYGALSAEHRTVLVRFCTRPRGARGKTLLQKLRNFRDTLATNQVRMNTINTFVLKLRSLYTWRDPDRTRFFVCVLALTGLVFAVVPFRLLFSAFLCIQLTKPLRSRSDGLVTLALRRFWEGIPIANIADPVYADIPDDTWALLHRIDPRLPADRGDIGLASGHSGTNRILLTDTLPLQLMR